MARATRNRRSSSSSPAIAHPDDVELDELADVDEPAPFDPPGDDLELEEAAPFDPPAPDDVNPLAGEEPALDEFGRALP